MHSLHVKFHTLMEMNNIPFGRKMTKCQKRRLECMEKIKTTATSARVRFFECCFLIFFYMNKFTHTIFPKLLCVYMILANENELYAES